jgi:L-fucose mutarotase
MLHKIPAILSPDILWSLRAMGHGDEILIADANFPATSTTDRCHRLDGLQATEVLKAVLTVLPLDTFVLAPALTMQVVGDPDAVPPITSRFQAIINEVADNPAPLQSLERFCFYDRAKTTFAVIQTGEAQPYGNIILKKGIIAG